MLYLDDIINEAMQAFVDQFKFQQYLHFAIITLPVMLITFTLVSVILLVIGIFETYLVVPCGVLAAIAAGYIIWKQQQDSYYIANRETLVFILLSLFSILLWTGYNLVFNSEHVFINRDPAIYTVSAKLLQNENDLNIEKVAIGDGEFYSSTAAGFDTSRLDNSELFSQGVHALPALLGLSARFFGDEAIFNGNVVLGGFALLSFFAFCLCILKARFAFLAMVGLSLLLPFMYFSRDAYSEILSLICIFGSITLLFHAINKQSIQLWFLAGLVMGAGTAARVDTYISIAAIIAFLGMYVILSKRVERKKALWQTGWFMGGLVPAATVGFLDAYIVSSGYFASEWRYISLELYLIVAVLILSAILILLSWKTQYIEKIHELTKKQRAKVLAVSVLLYWVIMASRFFWMEDPGHRSELVVLWIGAYLGPILFVAGVTGMALIGYRIMKYREAALRLAPVFLIITAIVLLYVTRPRISPDQVWASRRLLPVVFPGLIFAALYMIQASYEYLAKTKRLQNFQSRLAVGAIVFIGVLSPLVIGLPFLGFSAFKEGQAINDTCRSIPKPSMIIWLGRAGLETTISSRAFCEVDAIRYVSSDEKISPEDLEDVKVQLSTKQELLVGVYDSDRDMLPDGSNLSHVTDKVTQNIELVYRRPPTMVTTGSTKILIGKVNDNGKIIPLEAQ
tara:strand:+ start:7581 stop:9620 length:2040 start_codon:yes stop_codon:yes gene_type:complete